MYQCLMTAKSTMDKGGGSYETQRLKIEEIEVSHTLGGTGEGHVKGKGKWRG